MSESLLSQYRPPASRYDEMVDAEGAPRPHWRALLSHLESLPEETLRRRGQFVQDAIASDGVSYNVYADPAGSRRAWTLDLLPLVLPQAEWSGIAAAVGQRAKLLNAVLGDLYGGQQLIAEGLVPPALVFGQRSFLWPAVGIPAPGGVSMHVYAADLARGPDGTWWVLADRTRGPSGAGYALQNRITLSRAFPDTFRELQVEQLAPFFSALQDTLQRLSPAGSEAPLAVLLTPGPYNETYFEHSFLARYLGFPLVEGQDLVVRGDCVYLKTLRGLRRVHAILRRLDDDFCDPVELRADSALGIPGLMHVIRAGKVVMANALGSAVLETGAFAGFYPALAERLLGEKLAMPSVATWWCGEAPALDYVLAHLDELVIKPAYPSMHFEPVFGHRLDAAQKAELVLRLNQQPHAYLAQERVHLAHAPTWSQGQGGFVPRSTALRVFAVANADGSYTVLPGGLTRVAPRDGDVVSMQAGGASKDTWILTGRPVARIPLWRPRLGVADVARSVVDIASRVGENLFWMGRYAERCEGLARLLRAALVRVADAAPESDPALRSLTHVSEKLHVLAEDDDFVAAVVDPALPGGLAANVLRLQGCANQVRERLSTDNWHVLGRLPERLPGLEASVGSALAALDDVMLACVALAGFAMDDMTRDESWQFLLLGRRVERLAHVASTVAHVLQLEHVEREAALEWLLEAANSIVTFRARYRRAPELLPVLHLVVLDESNPHSVAFQVRELRTALDAATAQLGAGAFVDALAAFGHELEATALAGFELESGARLEGACKTLAEVLERGEQAAYGVSDELQRRFFSHAGTAVPLDAGARHR